MNDLKGSVALVTGSARGIGAAIALAYARAGANVVTCDLEASSAQAIASQARALGVQAEGYAADIGDPAQSAALVERTVQRFGRLDVLVNNAGVIRVQPLLKVTPEDWDFIHGVNTRGLFFALQAAARHMLEQAPLAPGRPRGKIINVASIAGRIGRPLMSAYAASKACVISLTKSAGLELAPHVTVNAICPGAVGTDMWKQIDAEWGALENRPSGAMWQERIKGVPLGRAETPEDLTGMALFLAGPGSDYITAQSYNVDGGLVPT